MSERQINDPQSTPPAPTPVETSASALASARRRRFIKAGAGVIPVALTLTSKPVLATGQGKCFSASAWGSIQTLINTTASQYVRKAAKAPTVTCYTLSDWCRVAYSNPTCGGWQANSISCANLQMATVKAYTVGKACGISSGRMAGMNYNVSCWTVLNNTNGTYSSYQKAMLIAWLNYRISGTTNTDVCVIDTFSSNQLVQLSSIVANNGGTGPDGKPWTPDTVLTYLDKNFIGRLT